MYSKTQTRNLYFTNIEKLKAFDNLNMQSMHKSKTYGINTHNLRTLNLCLIFGIILIICIHLIIQNLQKIYLNVIIKLSKTLFMTGYEI